MLRYWTSLFRRTKWKVISLVLTVFIGFLLLSIYSPTYIPSNVWDRQLHRVTVTLQAQTVTPDGFFDSVHLKSLHKNELRDGQNYTLDDYCASHTSKVNPHNFQYLITGEHVCSQSDPFLIVVIPSVHTHVEIRQTIRETWGSVSRSGVWADGNDLPDIKLIFLFGIQPGIDSYPHLEKESREYEDIAQENFVDSYLNLSIKSIFAMRWVDKYCPRAKYVLKSDEDTFVHFPRLLQLIRKFNSTWKLIGVRKKGSSRKDTGRWPVALGSYQLQLYPPYLQGQSYVLPAILVPELYKLSEYFPPVAAEDVYLTGILVYCSGAEHLDKSLEARFGVIKKKYRPGGIHECVFHQLRHRITIASLPIDRYVPIWRALRDNTCSNLPPS